MRTMAAQMKSFIGNVPILNGHMEGVALRSLLTTFGFLALLYILILGNMVWNIIERRAYEAEAHALGTEVRELELEYLELTSKVDLPYSRSLGFKEANATFATRKALGSLSVSKNEI